MWDKIIHATVPLLESLPVGKRLGRRLRLQQRFKTELELVKGTHKNPNKHPSVIHFSFHKAGTQYVRSVLTRCAVENGMVPVGVHDYAFHTDFPRLHSLTADEMKKYEHIFKPRGYLYSAFGGGMVEGIVDLDLYKVIFVTRDPRDILVSHYYSMAYSHATPEGTGNKHERFIKNRAMARASTIDEWVLRRSDKLYDTCVRYQELLLKKSPHTYRTNYEQMVYDFSSWLRGLLNYCELNISADSFELLLQENARIRPQEENIYHHLRKGQVGDYRNKLKPETIHSLNEKFASVLEMFGYDQE
jgi:hypothetical protein